MTINFKVYKGAFISHVTIEEDEDNSITKVTSETKNAAVFKNLISVWSVSEYSGLEVTDLFI